MIISKDIYDLNLLKEGMRVSEIIRNSSRAQLETLQQFNLISIDRGERVFLTEKGIVAKKIGVEKYIELEEFEKELTSTDPKEFEDRRLLLLTILWILTTILVLMLIFMKSPF